MSKTNIQFELMKKEIEKLDAKRSPNQKVRTINTIKWKMFMLQTLTNMKNNTSYDSEIIQNLHNIVQKIKEQNFIEAIVNLQTFKFSFKTQGKKQINGKMAIHNRQTIIQSYQKPPRKDIDELTTNSGDSSFAKSYKKHTQKLLKEKYDLLNKIIENKMLNKQLSSQKHPYFKIIEGFTILIQQKYKLLINKMAKKEGLIAIQEVIEQLSVEMNLIESFFKVTALPIFDIFNLNEGEEKRMFQENFHNYMVTYLRNNEKLCGSFKKIIKYALKSSSFLNKIQSSYLGIPDINHYQIEEKLKIQGQFFETTNQLIKFSEMIKGTESLQKLIDIRNAISKDVDAYYKQQKFIIKQISSQSQLQILKFLITKLKVFINQIYSQIKLLQILFGEQQISYFYDDASYIHSQLSIAYEALQLNL